MSLAADHLAIIATFIPALTKRREYLVCNSAAEDSTRIPVNLLRKTEALRGESGIRTNGIERRFDSEPREVIVSLTIRLLQPLKGLVVPA